MNIFTKRLFTEKILKKYNDCKYNKIWQKQRL